MISGIPDAAFVGVPGISLADQSATEDLLAKIDWPWGRNVAPIRAFSSHSYSPNPHKGSQMHSIIYLVGVVVVILLILSALGLR